VLNQGAEKLSDEKAVEDETHFSLYRPISADSHVTEPPNCYIDNIESRYRDRAPRIVPDPERGEVFVIDGVDDRIPLALVAAAGRDPKTLKMEGATLFESLHRGSWDPKARLLAQDVDGIAGEIIYPTIGMVLCGHPDPDYKSAAMWAYNRWLQGFVSEAPGRLFGIGQTAVRSVEEAIEDVCRFKEMGFRGVMLPSEPATEFDYDDIRFDPLWDACVAHGLPISFHILTSNRRQNRLATRGESLASTTKSYGGRGPAINQWYGVIRSVQDIIGMFIFGQVFDRNPDLKLVCVEGDAGWAPHYMFRMDHVYNHHRHWMKTKELARLPSDIFKSNVYLTFQDDAVAFRLADLCGPDQLLWGNDFPHTDATWPHSEAVVTAQTKHLTNLQKRKILRENVTSLYGLDV